MVAKSFVIPYIGSFLVAEFVLVIQFMWRYIERLTRQGITFQESMELCLFMGLQLMPRAIPISILLASVFVFGNMSERLELLSMKTSGFSLLRIMRTGIFIAIGTAFLSLFASNVIQPKANYWFYMRFDSLLRNKATLSIDEGVFNSDFKGFNIYVKEKMKDGKTVKDVKIYDQNSSTSSSMSLVSAQQGIMTLSPDASHFIMRLENGNQYRDLKEANANAGPKEYRYPFMRTSFESWTKAFDMSSFERKEQISLNRRKEQLLNSFQLMAAIDSVKMEAEINQDDGLNNYSDLLDIEVITTSPVESAPEFAKIAKGRDVPKKHLKNPSRFSINYKSQQHKDLDLSQHSSFLETLRDDERHAILKSANTKSQRIYSVSSSAEMQMQREDKEVGRYTLRLHQKWSQALICIIFLFIGAPLGSIIQKGGYGYPLLMAIIVFVIYILLYLQGEKLYRAEYLSAEMAAWLACLVLLPLAVYLTFTAINDDKFFSKFLSVFR